MNLDEFLTAFFPNEDEAISFRCFKPKDAPDSENNRPQNMSFSRKQLAEAGETELKRRNHHSGLYFAPNAGGHSDRDITRFNAIFVEDDKCSIEDQHNALDACPLSPSIRVETKRSVHAYWLLSESCTEAEWRDLQKRAIKYFGWDEANSNPARLMRLPFFTHLTYNEEAVGKYDCKRVELIEFFPERKYTLSELQEAFPSVEEKARVSKSALQSVEVITNGSRNRTLCSIAGGLRRQGLDESEIVSTLLEVNRNRVNPPLPESEVESVAKSIMRYEPQANIAGELTNGNSKETASNVEGTLEFPVLSDKARYGLAGEIVRMIEPHTEADPAALLVQLLSGFGCLIGKTAYFRAEADFHHTKLFTVLVGASSKGRKGTSWGQVRRLLIRVDESFAGCIQDGLSSGEGLIFHVRDPQTKKVPIKEKGRIVEYQDEIVDEGANEKRAFVLEPEFARVLRVMQRDGNTLSSVIRQAWDFDHLRIMTKNPIKAKEAHISITGHITLDELRRNLDETETSNGFANRFLWAATRRSKYLPEGGDLEDSHLNEVVQKLHKAVNYARITTEVKRNDEARQKWIETYPSLSDGHTGLLGSVTSRAEAQVMRLACIYALLDCSEEIRLEHLEAALALWQYCEDSARYIFGAQTGNKIADVIYSALLETETGLNRTQISALFQRNTSAGQINTALKLLVDLGRVEVIKEMTDGRPREVFKARRYEKNELNEIRRE